MKALRRLLSHGDGVAVLKSERRQPGHTESLAARGSDVRKRASGIGAHRRRDRIAENCDKPGAGVFGIHVDGIVAQRLKRNVG